MRTLTLLAILAVSSTSAFADAPAKKKPGISAADQKKYKAALDKGRKLEAKKQYADAIKAFQDCLAVSPDDATALTEMGWSAYLNKDLKLAEQYTRKAIGNQSQPNVRGAALYNLGLIRRDRKDTKAAIAAFSESLKVRPHSVVRAALAKLDPKAAAAFDPFAPVALQGSFKSIEAYCKTQPTAEDFPYADDGTKMECTCEAKLGKSAPKLAAPFEGVELIKRECLVPNTENGVVSTKLAVKVGGTWSLTEIWSQDSNRHCSEGVSFGSAKVQDVIPGGTAELLVTHEVEGNCVGGGDSNDWSVTALVVVGIGASKTPSATPSIELERKETHQQDAFDDKPGPIKVVTEVKLEAVWGKDGALTLKGKATGMDKSEAANRLGKHLLVFP